MLSSRPHSNVAKSSRTLSGISIVDCPPLLIGCSQVWDTALCEPLTHRPRPRFSLTLTAPHMLRAAQQWASSEWLALVDMPVTCLVCRSIPATLPLAVETGLAGDISVRARVLVCPPAWLDRQWPWDLWPGTAAETWAVELSRTCAAILCYLLGLVL